MSIDRDKGGRFLPGTVANPGGRPKVPEALKEKLSDYGELAVAALGDALTSPDLKLRFAAAQEVLNRILGKPHTTASVDVRHEAAASAHIEALIALAATKQGVVIEGVTAPSITPEIIEAISEDD